MVIENDRFVYVKEGFLPNITNFIYSTLLELGFQRDRILIQNPSKFGQIGDYIAQMREWSPTNFTFIIGKIKANQTFVGLKLLVDLPTDWAYYDELFVADIEFGKTPKLNTKKNDL